MKANWCRPVQRPFVRSQRAIACNGARQVWHFWHRRQRSFYKLRKALTVTWTDSVPGHHVFKHLQTFHPPLLFHSVPNLKRIWLAGFASLEWAGCGGLQRSECTLFAVQNGFSVNLLKTNKMLSLTRAPPRALRLVENALWPVRSAEDTVRLVLSPQPPHPNSYIFSMSPIFLKHPTTAF
jgi:hypothetical protein